MKKIYLISLALLGAFEMFATNYYVDGVNGSDKNDGKSPETAWKSFSPSTTNKAFFFRAGDAIYIKAGTTYANQQLSIIECKGTVEDPLVITSYGEGAKPIINMGTLASPLDGKRAALYLKNSSGVEVSNIGLENYVGSPTTTARQQKFGVYVYANGVGEVKHIKLTNLDVKNVKGNVASGDDVAGAGIFYFCEGEPATYFNGLEIGHCYFENIDRLAISGNNRAGRVTKWYNNINVHVHRNVLKNIGGQGITIKATDGAVCEYNLVDGCGLRDRGVGIWSYKADNTVFQYNIVTNAQGASDAQGYDSDWNCTNTIFQYNMSVNNEGGFMLVCSDGSEAWADDKYTWNAGLKGTTIRYNLSVNDGYRTRPGTGKAYFSPTFHITGPVRETHIYGNTLVVSEKSDEKMDRNFTTFMNWGDRTPNGVNFYNNIFYAGEGLVGEFDKHKQGKYIKTSRGVEFKNNIYAGEFGSLPTTEADMFPNGDGTADPARLIFDENGIVLSTNDPLFNCDKADIADFDITGLTYDEALKMAEMFKVVENSEAISTGTKGFIETLSQEVQDIQLDYYGNSGFNDYTPLPAKDYVLNNFGDFAGKQFDFFGNIVDDAKAMNIGFHQGAVEAGIENTTYEEITLYPTYVDSEVTVRNLEGRAYVISRDGSVLNVVEGEGSDMNINVDGYPSGIYFVKTNQGTGKFIKQ